MALKKLPVGIEEFREFFTDDFYYVDKTGLIIDLLQNWGKVNLFTRPRRFGKSLNMNMLQTFFEIGCEKELFDGLKIAQEKELCDEYMGQFPVVSISLKDVSGSVFIDARNALCDEIGREALRFQFLCDSETLSEKEKEKYLQLIEINPPAAGAEEKQAVHAMSDATLVRSLQMLTQLLSAHYGCKVILLIDEYDVPLDKAFQAGYYHEMIALIRSLFSNVLKTNPYLQFAVLTGCLRISKESIFTGLNNMKVHTITDFRYDEYFGFTDAEVEEILAYYGLSEHYDIVKEWYDGYRFGDAAVYCPWDVINYCDEARANPGLHPKNYWANTSGNGMVRLFIDKADKKTKNEIERLIAGETIVKEVYQELTYSELGSTIDNLWSVLFTTGYLTWRGCEDGKNYQLAIPNREIRELFADQIAKWFSETAKNDASKLDELCEAFPKGDTETIEMLFNDYLWNTISVRDTAVSRERKEHFYHGILLGLLGHKENWLVMSNAESGEGYSDILVEVPESRTGVVIEMKYAEDDKLEAGCQAALRQINEKRYDAQLLSDGMQTVVKYGIACFRKHCRVARGQ